MKTLRNVFFIFIILSLFIMTDRSDAYLVSVEKPCRYEIVATRQFYPQHNVEVMYRVDSIHTLNVNEAIIRIYAQQGASEILLHQDFVEIRQWRTVYVDISLLPDLRYNEPVTIKVVASNPSNPLVTGTGKGYVMVYRDGLNHEIQILRNGSPQVNAVGWWNFVNDYNCHALPNGLYYSTQNRIDFTVNGDFTNFILVPVPYLGNGFSGANPNSQNFWSYKYYQSTSQARFMTFAYTNIYNTAGQLLPDMPCSPEDAVIAVKKVYKIVLGPFTQYPNPLAPPSNVVIVSSSLLQGNGRVEYEWSDTNRPQGVEFIPDSNTVKLVYPAGGIMNESSPPHRIKLRCHNEFGSTQWKYYQVNRTNGISLCPMLNFTNGRDSIYENPLLNSSMNGDEDITDHYRINYNEFNASGDLNLNIKETGTDRSLIDRIGVKRVSFNEGENIAVTSSGEIINFRKGVGFTATVNFNKDISEILLENDDQAYDMKQGERIKLTVKYSGKLPNYLLLNVRQPALKYDIGGFVHSGKNKTDTFYVKNNENVVCIKLDANNNSGGILVIEAAQSFQIDKAELVSNRNTAQIVELDPLTAIHNADGDVLGRLAFSDRIYAELGENENIQLSFRINETSNMYSKTAYVISTTGRTSNDGSGNIEAKEINAHNTLKLNGNFPEPFNPSTTISFETPANGNVSLKVFDITGRIISELINEFRPAGAYALNFDGSNLSSGVYFYRLEVPSGYLIRKMTLIK